MTGYDEAKTALDLMRTQSNALEPDGDEGCDYTLTPGRTAWITVGKHSICITDDRIDIYPLGDEMSEPEDTSYLN